MVSTRSSIPIVYLRSRRKIFSLTICRGLVKFHCNGCSRSLYFVLGSSYYFQEKRITVSNSSTKYIHMRYFVYHRQRKVVLSIRIRLGHRERGTIEHWCRIGTLTMSVPQRTEIRWAKNFPRASVREPGNCFCLVLEASLLRRNEKS